MIRIHTKPAASAELDSAGADHDSLWTTPPIMKRD